MVRTYFFKVGDLHFFQGKLQGFNADKKVRFRTFFYLGIQFLDVSDFDNLSASSEEQRDARSFSKRDAPGSISNSQARNPENPNLLFKIKGMTDKAIGNSISFADSEIYPNDNSTQQTNFKKAKAVTPRSSQKKEDYLVGDLPDIIDPRLKQIQGYAGQLSILDSQDKLFFWLVQNKTNQLNKDTLFLWLNGGPGCTSMDGMFLENGPYIFDKEKQKLVMRDYAWTNLVDVLYIDQPFGTGFSPTSGSGFAQTYVDADRYLVNFLESFYKVFPEYKSRKLYISGESQAGVYLGYLAHSLLYERKDLGINLQGVMIGNGWIDPRSMYTSYAPFASALDLVSQTTLESMELDTNSCVKSLNNEVNITISDSNCERIFNSFLNDDKLGSGSCLNVYDLRLIESKPSCGMTWPPGLALMSKYLSRPDVQMALNVKETVQTFKECNSQVSRGLSFDMSPPSVEKLPQILSKVPVNLFSGDQDIICNQLGYEYMIGNLTWNGKRGFELVNLSTSFPRQKKEAKTIRDFQVSKSASLNGNMPAWTVNGEEAGLIHTERKLTYSIIYDASHMTGFDKPAEMLDLIKRFAKLNGSGFGSSLASDLEVLSGQQKSLLQTEVHDLKLDNPVNKTAFIILTILFFSLVIGLSFAIIRKAAGGGNLYRYFWFGNQYSLASNNQTSDSGEGRSDSLEAEYLQLEDLHRSSVQGNSVNFNRLSNDNSSIIGIVGGESLEYDFRNGNSFDYEKYLEDYDSSSSSGPQTDLDSTPN
ncbi:Pheromone-processing carboxypeptidase KEX1 [Smittium mucronatum]|uniref:Pheromone-processing carboxypeptidase KEX1 n=1 Tax=Smittium mucronatum TaxID=133383 RepID=A0A1R0H637_9FUNG|nr:Pheromone-processing carboxypeptidase KEX1 [Smittium mucronatum]